MPALSSDPHGSRERDPEGLGGTLTVPTTEILVYFSKLNHFSCLVKDFFFFFFKSAKTELIPRDEHCLASFRVL